MRLVTIASYEHPYEADLALALLADAGIPARRAGAYLPGMSTFFSGKMEMVRVEVPSDLAEEARVVLAGAQDPAADEAT